MKFGFCPSQEPSQFKDTLREAVLAEEAGYDGVFTTESHGSAVSQPAPLLRLAGLATHTSRVDLGTALVLLPLYHPVHVAEESALVDVMSGGRLILGLGAGRPPHWFETFGVSLRHRPSRMEEGIEIIRRLWAGGTVAYRGRRFSFSQGAISPLPVQRPGPRIWIGGSQVPAYARAARLADGILVEPAAANSTVAERIAAYREALPPASPGERREVVLMRGTFTSRNRAKLQRATDAYLRYFKESYGRLGALDVMGPGGAPPTDYSIFVDRFVIGEPEQCVERIKTYRDMGVDYYIIMGSQLPGLPRDEVVESMQIFAREVIPQLR